MFSGGTGDIRLVNGVGWGLHTAADVRNRISYFCIDLRDFKRTVDPNDLPLLILCLSSFLLSLLQSDRLSGRWFPRAVWQS